jgi:hypothetical protein
VASAYGWVTRVLSMVKRAHIFHILTLCELLDEFIQEIGVQDVVQVIT